VLDECVLTTTKRGLLVIEIIVALIAVFGAVLPYLLQKNKELNLKIAEQKREAYASFLKNFTTVAVAVMHDEDVLGKGADMERMLARGNSRNSQAVSINVQGIRNLTFSVMTGRFRQERVEIFPL